MPTILGQNSGLTFLDKSSAAPGIDKASPIDECKETLALLAANDNLTNSVDIVYFIEIHIVDIGEKSNTEPFLQIDTI